jgi:hypothetical protein
MGRYRWRGRVPIAGRAAVVAASLALALTAPGTSAREPSASDEHHDHAGRSGHGMLMMTRGGYVLTHMHDLDFNLATARQIARARALLARTHAAAGRMFLSLRAARTLGYLGNPHRRYHWKWVGDHYAKVRGRPRLLHLSNPFLLHDRHVLDPRYPESLVYLRRPRGWRLVAFMYRAPIGPVPTPGGQITRWHLHGGCAAPGRVPRDNISVEDPRCPAGTVLHYGRDAMMHVWLAHTLRAGFSMSPPGELVRAERDS